jgi:hypothetical protein
MSKCKHCGLELSSDVIRIHEDWCEGEQMQKLISKHVESMKEETPTFEIVLLDSMTDEEIREKAKLCGIKSWHNKSIEKIKEELSARGV